MNIKKSNKGQGTRDKRPLPRSEIEAVRKLREDLQFSRGQGEKVAVITDQFTVAQCLMEIETLDTCYTKSFARADHLTDVLRRAHREFSGLNLTTEKNMLGEMLAAADGGVWWCNTHQREATHRKHGGRACCDPALGGILAICDAVWAPMEISKTK